MNKYILVALVPLILSGCWGNKEIPVIDIQSFEAGMTTFQVKKIQYDGMDCILAVIDRGGSLQCDFNTKK